MAAPAAVVVPIIDGMKLVAEFEHKKELLAPWVAEPALCAEIALASLDGAKEDHFKAAAGYSLPMLRALTAQHGLPTYADAATAAAAVGHLAGLQYLHAASMPDGCPGNMAAITAAANGGHLACLQYLHTNGCDWDNKAILAAATGGHLACLQYLHENGCPWHVWTAFMTAIKGNLACLKYADEHGCVWNASVSAATGDCVEYCRNRVETQVQS
jgi:hypothetical protein